MSFPAKFPGVCRGCGGAIVVGQEIVWKKDEGAWHDDCAPGPGPVDFAPMARYLQEKHAASGLEPEPNLEPGENATLIAAGAANASVGIRWVEGVGYMGRGFT